MCSSPERLAMFSLPIAFSSAIGVFAPVFSRPVWPHVNVLMTGAVLAPGPRTVTAILRIMGRSAAPDFQTYHRVLNRAVWSPLTASRLLLRLLVAVFVPRGVVVCGLDDTIERRRGDQIAAKGIYRDPVRSSHTHVVKASGLRWLACMVLVPLSWADRVWALPFLTALCPSERFYEQRGRHHQQLQGNLSRKGIVPIIRIHVPGVRCIFVVVFSWRSSMRTLKLHFPDDALPTLDTFLKQTKEARGFRRAQAVRAVVTGHRLQTVSDTLHFTYSALRKWVHRFASQGGQGLADRPRPGRPPKVTCGLAHSLDRLVDQDPLQHGSSHSQWSCQALATRLARQTGVQLSRESVPAVLKKRRQLQPADRAARSRSRCGG